MRAGTVAAIIGVLGGVGGCAGSGGPVAGVVGTQQVEVADVCWWLSVDHGTHEAQAMGVPPVVDVGLSFFEAGETRSLIDVWVPIEQVEEGQTGEGPGIYDDSRGPSFGVYWADCALDFDTARIEGLAEDTTSLWGPFDGVAGEIGGSASIRPDPDGPAALPETADISLSGRFLATRCAERDRVGTE